MLGIARFADARSSSIAIDARVPASFQGGDAQVRRLLALAWCGDEVSSRKIKQMRSGSECIRGNDEIDVFELASRMWRQKPLIALMSGLGLGIALVYVLLAKPVYEAKVFIRPPSSSDISQLNQLNQLNQLSQSSQTSQSNQLIQLSQLIQVSQLIQQSQLRPQDILSTLNRVVGNKKGFVELTEKDVYDVYLRKLQSESLRRDFFYDDYLPNFTSTLSKGEQDALYAKFKSAVTVTLTSRGDANRYVVRVELPDARQAAELAEGYVKAVGSRAVDELIKAAEADVKSKTNSLEREIDLMRARAQQKREDQVAQLTEALRIARLIDLEKPSAFVNVLYSGASAVGDGTLAYMRGTKALEAEIETLRSRVSDDPFIEHFRERQQALELYKGLEFERNGVHVYRQEGGIESSGDPMKPRRLVAIILGLMGGVFWGW